MKIKRQNGQSSIQAAPAARVFRNNPPDAEAPVLRKVPPEPLAEPDNSKLMLVAVIVVLILLSIAAILA